MVSATTATAEKTSFKSHIKMGAGKSKQKLKKKQRDELQAKTQMSDEDIMAWHRGKKIFWIYFFSGSLEETYIKITCLFCRYIFESEINS